MSFTFVEENVLVGEVSLRRSELLIVRWQSLELLGRVSYEVYSSMYVLDENLPTIGAKNLYLYSIPPCICFFLEIE